MFEFLKKKQLPKEDVKLVTSLNSLQVMVVKTIEEVFKNPSLVKGLYLNGKIDYAFSSHVIPPETSYYFYIPFGKKQIKLKIVFTCINGQNILGKFFTISFSLGEQVKDCGFVTEYTESFRLIDTDLYYSDFKDVILGYIKIKRIEEMQAEYKAKLAFEEQITKGLNKFFDKLK
jgi:hypothetical protein